MKMSIITVSYNSAFTIRDTFESILNQTYQDIEYVIVDGGSVDLTISIIKEYQSRFNGRMRWISEPDNGIYDAMNKGIQMATGDIIGILNSDDYYIHSNVIEKIVKGFEKEHVDAIYANLIHVNWYNTNKINRIVRSKPYKPLLFFRGWSPQHPTFFVKRNIYIQIWSFQYAIYYFC